MFLRPLSKPETISYDQRIQVVVFHMLEELTLSLIILSSWEAGGKGGGLDWCLGIGVPLGV